MKAATTLWLIGAGMIALLFGSIYGAVIAPAMHRGTELLATVGHNQ